MLAISMAEAPVSCAVGKVGSERQGSVPERKGQGAVGRTCTALGSWPPWMSWSTVEMPVRSLRRRTSCTSCSTACMRSPSAMSSGALAGPTCVRRPAGGGVLAGCGRALSEQQGRRLLVVEGHVVEGALVALLLDERLPQPVWEGVGRRRARLRVSAPRTVVAGSRAVAACDGDPRAPAVRAVRRTLVEPGRRLDLALLALLQRYCEPEGHLHGHLGLKGSKISLNPRQSRGARRRRGVRMGCAGKADRLRASARQRAGAQK